MKRLLVAIVASCGAIALLMGPFAVRAEAAPLSNDQQAQVQALVRQYLLAHPEVVEQAMQTLETRRAMARYQKITTDPRQFSIGPRNAKVGIVEFFDYRCPHCKDALAWTMDKVRHRPDVRVTFVEFPILSPESLEASRAALAAMKQGRYLAFHQGLMRSRTSLEDKDIDAIARQAGIDVARMHRDMRDPAIMALLEDNHDIAAAGKIEGTPGFLINGEYFDGYSPAALDQGLRLATAVANGRKAAG